MDVYAHVLIWYSKIDYLFHLDYEKKQIDILEKYERTHDLV